MMKETTFAFINTCINIADLEVAKFPDDKSEA